MDLSILSSLIPKQDPQLGPTKNSNIIKPVLTWINMFYKIQEKQVVIYEFPCPPVLTTCAHSSTTHLLSLTIRGCSVSALGLMLLFSHGGIISFPLPLFTCMGSFSMFFLVGSFCGCVSIVDWWNSKVMISFPNNFCFQLIKLCAALGHKGHPLWSVHYRVPHSK